MSISVTPVVILSVCSNNFTCQNPQLSFSCICLIKNPHHPCCQLFQAVILKSYYTRTNQLFLIKQEPMKAPTLSITRNTQLYFLLVQRYQTSHTNILTYDQQTSEQETGSTEAPRHRPVHSKESELPLPLADGRAGTCYSASVVVVKEVASLATLEHISFSFFCL
jgi:hypothetical protein